MEFWRPWGTGVNRLKATSLNAWKYSNFIIYLSQRKGKIFDFDIASPAQPKK